MVDSRDGDRDFDLDARVVQKDTLAPYMLTKCLEYILRSSIDPIKDGSTLKKVQSRQYPAETITDADYADNLAFSQIHLTKQNPYCIAKNGPRELLIFTRMQIK